MDLTLPLTERHPAVNSQCHHRPDCSCRRPYIGRALVTSVALELIMGMAAIISGATLIGAVACGAMAFCIWLFALSEIIAFYRIGLPEPKPQSGPVTAPAHRPHQAW